ncbi:MAG: hypothetical protein HY587_03660 [Candidatus Omnitrophica bacterium]|nr:hypothetical protein [Candidatus Omnitrophota bacterium]
MVRIYNKKWERGFFQSLFGYLRDTIVLALPMRRLPDFLIQALYGVNAKFAFLVHPRMYEDAFISAPFLKMIKFFLRKQKGYQFVAGMSPFVLNSVKTKQSTDGLVIAQLTVPEVMFERRKETLRMLEKALRLVSKICSPRAVVGLGGWFPMVVRRGVSLHDQAESLSLRITNGHCGTLASIYMTVEKIAKIAEISLADLIIAVIGVGKMGSNIARAFNGKVKGLVLIDVKENNLLRICGELKETKSRTKTRIVVTDSVDRAPIRQALIQAHIGICATSSFRNLLRLKDMPDGFVAIDDSRPEALPRDPRRQRIVLEGGLLRIHGVQVNYDYGFGQDENVFGCLGEAFLLALDQDRSLKPTVGDVDMGNFFRVLSFCRENGVTEGDLKSSTDFIADEDIREALKKNRMTEGKDSEVFNL